MYCLEPKLPSFLFLFIFWYLFWPADAHTYTPQSGIGKILPKRPQSSRIRKILFFRANNIFTDNHHRSHRLPSSSFCCCWNRNSIWFSFRNPNKIFKSLCYGQSTTETAITTSTTTAIITATTTKNNSLGNITEKKLESEMISIGKHSSDFSKLSLSLLSVCPANLAI